MYTYGITSNRCSLCYALLSANTKPTSSTISYSSSVSRRHANRSMTQSLEKLISSSRKFQNLWRKNENGLVNHRSICYRCCDTVEKIEDIKSNIEKLNIQQDTLVNKIEHYLHKRALILQAQRQRTNSFSSSIYQHQVLIILFVSSEKTKLFFSLCTFSRSIVDSDWWRRRYRRRRRKAKNSDAY